MACDLHDRPAVFATRCLLLPAGGLLLASMPPGSLAKEQLWPASGDSQATLDGPLSHQGLACAKCPKTAEETPALRCGVRHRSVVENYLGNG